MHYHYRICYYYFTTDNRILCPNIQYVGTRIEHDLQYQRVIVQTGIHLAFDEWWRVVWIILVETNSLIWYSVRLNGKLGRAVLVKVYYFVVCIFILSARKTENNNLKRPTVDASVESTRCLFVIGMQRLH